MGVGAPRGALRQGPQPYGVQQPRNLRNALTRDGVSPSGVSSCLRLFRSVKSSGNKGVGKTGGSRRGKTGASSGAREYWV